MLTNQVVCNRKCARLLIYSLLVLLGSIVGLLFKRSFHLNAQVENSNEMVINSFKLDAEFDELLKSITIPRAVGSQNHTKVRQRILRELDSIQWGRDVHTFTSKINNLKHHVEEFRNVIGYANKNADNYVVLACHYDSLNTKHFVGAIDSAIPCSMILFLARILTKFFHGKVSSQKLSLMLIFFDGEEAFYNWNEHDSIYGARALARKWQRETFLHKINLFLLLDLIGDENPVFCNYFRTTQDHYRNLNRIEKNFIDNGYIEKDKHSMYFSSRPGCPRMMDDHIPFLERGVPVLHLIPKRYPRFWHTLDDNLNVYHNRTVQELIYILAKFFINHFE